MILLVLKKMEVEKMSLPDKKKEGVRLSRLLMLKYALFKKICQEKDEDMSNM